MRIKLEVWWVPVAEGLPAHGAKVLVADVDGRVHERWVVRGQKGKVWLPEDATHWMAMPVAPADAVLRDGD